MSIVAFPFIATSICFLRRRLRRTARAERQFFPESTPDVRFVDVKERGNLAVRESVTGEHFDLRGINGFRGSRHGAAAFC
jgi:hypothetical protein